MRITIDTNILKRAFNINEDFIYIEIITLIKSHLCKLCIDLEQNIKKEYDKNLKGSARYETWWKELRKDKLIDYCNGNLPNKHTKSLSKLGCHEPSDHIIIAVALHSDKILFTEDSDMGKGTKGHVQPHCQALVYLTSNLGLRVCDAKEGKDLILKNLNSVPNIQ
ncbi:MAG: hypothetical protein DWQ05_16830 [Calditrichaeota bacterium]|nr:MAG: hypothetical protein DWQ05_16830 [Calditrichota bacterium]